MKYVDWKERLKEIVERTNRLLAPCGPTDSSGQWTREGLEAASKEMRQVRALLGSLEGETLVLAMTDGEGPPSEGGLTNRETAEAACLIYRRFGKDADAATAAWRRMTEDPSISREQFMLLVMEGFDLIPARASLKAAWERMDRGDANSLDVCRKMLRQVQDAMPYLSDRPAYGIAARDAALTTVSLRDRIRAMEAGTK